jgi:hypothetical protein
VPVELPQRYYGATYTPPQTSIHRVDYINLTGKVEATPIWTIEGSAHVRVFDQKRRRLMPTGLELGHAPPLRRSFALATIGPPANGLNGAQFANPFDPGAMLGRIIERRPVRRRQTCLCRRSTPINCADITIVL